MTNSANPLGYLGIPETDVPQIIIGKRAPTLNDTNRKLGDLWIDLPAQNIYALVHVGAGGAIWTLLGGTSSTLDSLTGDDGIAVLPIANNINVQGGGAGAIAFTSGGPGQLNANVQVDNATIQIIANKLVATAVSSEIRTVTGNSGGAVPGDVGHNINIVGDGTSVNIAGNIGTNTLTVSASAAVATSYTEDAGTATPALNNLNILGAGGITTSGAGSTVTITAGATIPTTFTEDAGTATPALNNINILGAGGITTSGAGSTVTITAGATIATTYDGNAGTATPALNVLNILGSGVISTSAAGNTVTISSTSAAAFVWQTTTVNIANLVKGNGYFAIAAGGALTFGLPTFGTSVIGDTFIVALNGATSWQVTQAANQQIILGSSSTAAGAGGSLTSTANGDLVELVFQSVVGGVEQYVVTDVIGNITVV
jgi:hypothetical protein